MLNELASVGADNSSGELPPVGLTPQRSADLGCGRFATVFRSLDRFRSVDFLPLLGGSQGLRNLHKPAIAL